MIVEFESLEQIRRWCASPEHTEALRYRDAALERGLSFVDGANTPPDGPRGAGSGP